jgi:flagellar biosynthetic protein FliR
MAVMFVTDIALGLLTRAAPMLNAFALGFPLKIAFSLVLVGLVVVRVPQLLDTLVRQAVGAGLRLSGG